MTPRKGVPRPVVGLVAAVVAVVTPLGGLTGCSSEKDAFCDRLRDTFDMSELRGALDRNDPAAIEAALRHLQELEDLAPAEVEPDVRVVIDTTVDTVRRITGVTGPNGEAMPIDLLKLNQSLATVDANAQRVVAFADRECGLRLAR